MVDEQLSVLIVGGGLVGLSVSLLLLHHGIPALLVERHSTTSIHPRLRGVNARTMEIFRGHGSLGHLLNILFTADLRDLVRGREFSLCLIKRPEVRGLLTSINNTDRWVFHLSYEAKQGVTPADYPPERCLELLHLALGVPQVKIEITSILPWECAVRVAEDFQRGRILLAGDYEGTLKVEYQATALSEYSVTFEPDHKDIAQVTNPRRIETHFRSPQLDLWQFAETEWVLALCRPDYAPRKSGQKQPGALQSVLPEFPATG